VSGGRTRQLALSARTGGNSYEACPACTKILSLQIKRPEIKAIRLQFRRSLAIKVQGMLLLYFGYFNLLDIFMLTFLHLIAVHPDSLFTCRTGDAILNSPSLMHALGSSAFMTDFYLFHHMIVS
jgi:hypothetical protein